MLVYQRVSLALLKLVKDLTHEDKKISGSAFKHAPDRQVSLHHGTILFLADVWEIVSANLGQGRS
jgi:lipoate-protein ligase A